MLGKEKPILTSTKISTPVFNSICEPDRDEPLSKELSFSQGISAHRPACTTKVNEKALIGLVDMDNDVTILSSESWMPAWLTSPTSTALIGLGCPQSISPNILPLPYASHDR